MSKPYEIAGAVFYSCYAEEEILRNQDPDDAIETYLDDVTRLPETITITGYKPVAEPDDDGEVELEVCGAREVKVREWVRANRPDWLKEGGAFWFSRDDQTEAPRTPAHAPDCGCESCLHRSISRDWTGADDLTDTELAGERGYEGDV